MKWIKCTLNVSTQNQRYLCAVWTQSLSLHCVCFSTGQLNEYGQIIRAVWQELAFPSCGWEYVCVKETEGEKLNVCGSASRCFANWTFFRGSARSVGSYRPYLSSPCPWTAAKALQPPFADQWESEAQRQPVCERKKLYQEMKPYFMSFPKRRMNGLIFGCVQEILWLNEADMFENETKPLSQLDKEKLLMRCEWLMVSLQKSLSMIKRLGPAHRQRFYLCSIKGRSWAEWMNAEAVAGL